MSPSAYITVRVRKNGKRSYVVRYRRGGRMTAAVHAGSFKTRREANLRRDFVAGELAAGRDPKIALAQLAAGESGTVTLLERFDAFIASRVDVGEKTRRLYRNARDRLGDLGEMDPATIRPAHVQAWIAKNSALAAAGRKSSGPDDTPTSVRPDGDSGHRLPVAASAGLSARSLKQYLSTLRQVLDFCEVEPNPARSKLVRLPAEDVPEVAPPDGPEWVAVKTYIRDRSALPARVAEACALRVEEVVSLEYGDVDFAEGRLRISRTRTKRRTAGQRWIAVPQLLLDEVADLLPLEDRARDRRVFTISDADLRGDLRRACRDAGIAHYHPHDLRHRRISLWLAHGIDPITVKTWSGHSRASMSLDVYGHVVIDPLGDEWRSFWLDTYRRERLPKDARDREEDPQPKGGNLNG